MVIDVLWVGVVWIDSFKCVSSIGKFEFGNGSRRDGWVWCNGL